jgi:thiol:disulfide interchange protein DsbC
MKTKIILGTVLPSGLILACPTANQLDKALHNLLPQANLKVVKVEPSPVKGICQAVVNFGGLKTVLYTDQSGRYMLVGYRGLAHIIDLQTKEDITKETIQELNRLSQKDLKELDKYVAFTYGHKGKVVYLFTDPECPFCQKLEPTLKKLADEGKIQIKVILFPLPFHPHAKEKAIAAVCQNLGWNSLQRDYWTEDKMKKLKQWQCEKGKKLVEESIKIGNKYKVAGTPTIITEEGKKVVGALPEPMLVKELGLEGSNSTNNQKTK